MTSQTTGSLVAPLRIAAGSLALLAVAILPTHAEPGVTLKDSVPHVTTSGTSRIEVKPDLALITLGVQIEKPTAENALAETARLTKAIVDDLATQNIAERDIRTIDLKLVATYDEEHDANGRVTKRTLRGYRALDLLSLRIRDVDRAGAIARRALDHGANLFNGIDFQLEHAADRRIELGGDAAKRARLQAETYVHALGLSLGRVIEIESPNGGNYADLPNRRVLAAAAAAPTNDAPIPLAPGVVVVESTVLVTFELKAP